ncbi:glycosyltransferase [Aspergillus fijiensis CBS 313.89]|uniref:Capsule polysaccharide biosynthesis protein n=1 Tax=Aspergillus fijiensis CBS 313.89 TaxID=1448319 RepID=A0A8G1RJM6_9EURO|nr:capsule polysaccharide biosynthesis protein [Aspergillus fijiensis CBS 313.89]RAK72656.1 capsule polysaccharide biosynthesis protein [Aspergillus fijiensis CBS 313.89]
MSTNHSPTENSSAQGQGQQASSAEHLPRLRSPQSIQSMLAGTVTTSSQTNHLSTMGSDNLYTPPVGMHAIPHHLLDLRDDSQIDHDIIHAKPVSDEKNIWFFWTSGYTNMHPYTRRNVRAWHRRFSKLGWTIRVLDCENVREYLDVTDPTLFPRAFADGTIGGTYAPQHTSDLVRFPLLLRYGGVYADVGFIQIGDLDRLWIETIANPASRFEVLSYFTGLPDQRGLTNYFLAARKDNPLFLRCHKLLLKLWEGKTSTDGMHASPLLKGVPLMGGSFKIEEGSKIIDEEETSKLLTDYIIQGQVVSMVMGLVDEEDGWNGPEYIRDHLYGIDFMEGSQLINVFTDWDGRKAFELMSLPLPKAGEVETPEQKQAREVVEGCLTRSFGFKLAHGLILRVFKETLGSLWRKHEGSDIVPGTYAHMMRHAIVYWNQDALPPTLEFTNLGPIKRGPLLRDE